MVVAYLRGLLKPSLNYGLRSIVAESYVFDAILADNHLKAMELTIASDSAVLPALKFDSRKETLRIITRRLKRCIEIRNGEIYSSAKPEPKQGEISLYQLYHLFAKTGILSTLTGKDTPPMHNVSDLPTT